MRDIKNQHTSSNQAPSHLQKTKGFRSWLIAVVLVAVVSVLLCWVSNHFSSLHNLGAFFLISLFSTAILLGGFWLFRHEKPPSWIIRLVVVAALLRLFFGAVWFVALPLWGHGTPAEKAGYIMGDAASRDQAAWKLAHSEKPLWTAFQNNRATDQYGGLLFLSACVYRVLGGDAHQPLIMVFLTASFSALAVLFAWAFSRRAWDDQVAGLAAWIVALYPEAILIGSSQMREAFTITLGAAAFYGLVAYQKERKHWLLAWLVIPVLLYMVFSPPFAALLLGMLGLTIVIPLLQRLQWKTGSWRLWLTVFALAVLALLGLWLTLRQFTPARIHNPVEMLAWWLRKSANLQALMSKHASGWIQKTFKMAPEWARLPMLIGYGILQPFLPAALIVGSQAPIWPWITAFRSIGWTLLLALLAYSPLIAFRRNRENYFSRTICAIVWIGIIIASFRAGGDMWDNPRYRSAFLGIQAGLAAWVWIEHRRIEDKWLKRIVLGFAAILVWFIPWYMYRYWGLGWPISDLFTTIVGGLLTAVVLIFWDWRKSKMSK